MWKKTEKKPQHHRMENNCNTMTTNIIFWNKATSKKSESIVAKDGEK